MEVQSGKDGAAEKGKRTRRGRWTPDQRQEIVAASLITGASSKSQVSADRLAMLEQSVDQI